MFQKLISAIIFFAALSASANGGDIGSGEFNPGETTFASSGGNILIPAKQLHISSPDQSVSFEDSYVQIQVDCRYAVKMNFHGASSKSCGGNVLNFRIPANGIVSLPAIEKFPGFFHVRDASNYIVSIVVVRKGNKVSGLMLRSVEAMALFTKIKPELYFVTLKKHSFDIQFQGKPLFGSQSAQLPKAFLSVSVDHQTALGLNFEMLSVRDYSAVSVASANGGPDASLFKATSIEVPSFTYAYFPGLSTSLTIDAKFIPEFFEQPEYSDSYKVDVKDYENLRALNIQTKEVH